jgi:hypothetical protein
MTDGSLAGLMERGESFESLMRSHGARLVQALTMISLDREAAADVAQEAFTVGNGSVAAQVSTTCSMRSGVARPASRFIQGGQPGQSLKTTRVVTENGKLIRKNVWTNVWEMYPEETAVGTATTKPTTTTTKPPTTTTTILPPTTSTAPPSP